MDLCHINPHLCSGDSWQIAGAGVIWHLVNALDKVNSDLAALAVIGAIGDVQENGWQLDGENAKLLKLAITNQTLRKQKGIRIFGRKSRPLHKALAYSMDPYIPGISGDESAAVQFLADIGLSPKRDNEFITLDDLTHQEQRKLASAIIWQRTGESDPGQIFGDIYELQIGSREVDGQEFATTLNAAGRLGQGSIGVLACLGDPEANEKLQGLMVNYRRLVGNYLKWVRGGSGIKKTKNAIYIISRNEIDENFIGTITSICAKSFWPDKFVIGFANTRDGQVKVSGRGDNLREAFTNATGSVGGEGGGHNRACGAYIPVGTEKKFIKIFEEILCRR
jgi:RecJ-like exonuclease